MSGALNRKVQEVYVGASESGKSSRMKVRLVRSKPARLAIFDPKREYGGFGDVIIDGERGDSLAVFAARVLAGGPQFRVVFQPRRSRSAMRTQFNRFCLVCDQAQRMTVLADELADLTEPNWAPEGWEMLTRQGRHAQLEVLGASQSPSDLDKTFYRNCSTITIFRLIEAADIDRVAKMLAFDRASIAARRTEIAHLADHESLVLTTATADVQKKITTARELRTIP